jgi:hypothetical protein
MTGTCWNGTTAFTVPALGGTFLGSFYCTTGATSPACVTQQFKPAAVNGGTGNVLGLCSANNQRKVISVETDGSLSPWTYAVAAFRAADNSIGNRINVLDCLGQSVVRGYYSVDISTTTSAFIGIDLDSTTGTPNKVGFTTSPAVIRNEDTFSPQFGLHFYQAVEYAGSSTTFSASALAGGDGKLFSLTVELEL